MIDEGKFRSDLYFRLNVVTIFLPPLRERRSDIPLLIDHFLQRLAKKLQREVPHLDSALTDYLLSHDWPGNVRQLRNCLESMLVLAERNTRSRANGPHARHLRENAAAQAERVARRG
jgi:transcriptional regulator with PAS, ATPase and Fis domain